MRDEIGTDAILFLVCTVIEQEWAKEKNHRADTIQPCWNYRDDVQQTARHGSVYACRIFHKIHANYFRVESIVPRHVRRMTEDMTAQGPSEVTTKTYTTMAAKLCLHVSNEPI